MEEWNVSYNTYTTGQIITLGGSMFFKNARYRVTKATSTAIAVERYYWFDAAYDWIVRRVQAWRQK